MRCWLQVRIPVAVITVLFSPVPAQFALAAEPLDPPEPPPPVLQGGPVLYNQEQVEDSDPVVSEEVYDAYDAYGAAECGNCGCNACRCCSEPWVVSREPILSDSCIDRFFDALTRGKERLKIPVGFGAWHWWHDDLVGDDEGYGINGLRGTYYWYITADPEYDLGCDRKIGGHMELRLRETDLFRSFVPEQVWPYEAYAFYETPELGKLKAGQIWRRFGLDWDGVFWGNAPYFDGQKLDPDFGVAWESTNEVDDCFKVDRYFQFFFHEDNVNGSFAGADAESSIGFTERETGVVRLVPTWTREDGSTVALGVSGMFQKIVSERADVATQDVGAYAVDVTYTRGPWKLFIEGQQRFGILNPVNYISAGPSNRATNFLGGIHYTRGAVTYRANYSNTFLSNPDATQNMLDMGMTVTVTKNVDFYFEYVNQQISGSENPASNGPVFHSFEFVVHWHF